MSAQKLILLKGFAGVGKSTIAERYIDDHPLAMNFEEDRLIVMLGQWMEREEQARELVFGLGQVMVAAHLESGYNVIVPCLPTNAEHSKALEDVARRIGAQFFEIVLDTERDDAIQRLRARGTWGEEGAPPITDADVPVIEALYDTMQAALAERPDTIRIPCLVGEHDVTYQLFLTAIGESLPPATP